MKINLARIAIIFVLSGVGSVFGATQAYASPRLTLDPGSATVANGANLQLNVTIDVEANPSLSSDAVISVASNDFDVVSVTNGGFFPDFAWANDPGNNRIEIHAGSFQLFSSKTGAGTLATVTLRAKKTTGNSVVSFACGSAAPTSQILNSSGANILSCGSVNQSTVTFGQSSQPTSTPIPTVTPNPTATSAPSGGNNIDPVCDGLSVNKTSGTSPLTLIFTCSGSDSNNDVNYAEFTFGDGQQLSIEKNVGQKGSISTNHTYTITGSFTASCRVRDNNGSFSSRPATCQKTITVNRAAPAGPTKTPTPTLMPTPSTALVTLSTPTPTLSDLIIPTPTPEETKKREFVFPWVSASVGGIILVGVFLTWWYVRRKPPVPPIPPPIPFVGS